MSTTIGYVRKDIVWVDVENLAADGDISARAVLSGGSNGAVIERVVLLPQGTASGVDNSNTSVIALKDKAGNTIVSKTYNATNTFPADGVIDSLGTVDATHCILTADEVATLSVTNGTNANLPAFRVGVEIRYK